MITFNNLSGVVLDIEGTTCPLDFVSNSLFPHARAAIPKFVEQHRNDPKLINLWNELDQTIAAEEADQAPKEMAPYLQWLIDQDRKVAPLKELQGLIWREGYAEGNLKAPLFNDVEKALRNWRSLGLKLAVYSSGSIEAQKLLYRHSSAGDLNNLFSGWYDTRIGSKLNSQSYVDIALNLGIKPLELLFISDIPLELEAAKKAGYQVCGSQRAGNKFFIDKNLFPVVNNFNQLKLESK
jgi:enolase-phosphatase E1